MRFLLFYSIAPGAFGKSRFIRIPSTRWFSHFSKRFHQVFSLAYARFRDIEKAEAVLGNFGNQTCLGAGQGQRGTMPWTIAARMLGN